FNQPITDIVGGAGLFSGSRVFEYFVSMFGTRKGVTDTALLMGYSGFIARRLVDVSHDVVIKAEDCNTTSGVYISRIENEGELIETFRGRAKGRTNVEKLLDPRKKDRPVLVEAQEIIDERTANELSLIDEEYYARRKEAGSANDPAKAIQKLEEEYAKCGFRIGDHGELQVTIRSPLTCDLERGICAKCYGWDLSTSKLVEVGTAVGVIAAETMSEPLSQLTMRTFHHGGVATGTVLTGYNQAGRMYGSLHQELKADLASEETETTQLPDFVGEQRKLIDTMTGKAPADGDKKPADGAKPKKSETPPAKTTPTNSLRANSSNTPSITMWEFRSSNAFWKQEEPPKAKPSSPASTEQLPKSKPGNLDDGLSSAPNCPLIPAIFPEEPSPKISNTRPKKTPS